jgi:prepilin-type N-terminal cleavage/methylation domain-containing protein
MSQRGFTVLELLLAVGLGAILIAIAVPSFLEIVRKGRHGSAVRRVVSDLREIRSDAISTGWEYRIVGYSTAEDGDRRNQYRIFGRRSSSIDWPDEETAPLRTATQMAGRWISLEDEYPGVDFEGDADRFEVTFNSRGSAPGASSTFNPLHLTDDKGHDIAVNVAIAGSIRVE